MTTSTKTSTKGGALLTIRQAAEALFGEGATKTDENRLYRMIKTEQITATVLGTRKFIPQWQLEKLVKRQEPINVVNLND